MINPAPPLPLQILTARASRGALLAWLLATAPAPAAADGLDGDGLLDPTRVVQIRLTLRDADWETLRHQARHAGSFFAGAPIDDPYSYFKADLSIDKVRIPSVGVRKKGLFGSSDDERPSLKIKFDEFIDQDPIEGLDRLTLNNNKQDGSQVSQYLTYKVFRDAGVHAPRTGFARVVVNGEDLGIYTHVESIKKPFLRRCFDDDSGNLYEGQLTDFHPRTLEKIEIKTRKKDNDRTDLVRMVELLDEGAQLSVEAVQERVDLPGFLSYWATEALVGFWDGYSANQNNYYLYVVPESGLMYFIPWGADSCFSSRRSFGGSSDTAVFARSILCNRLFHLQDVEQAYYDTLLMLLDEVWNEAELIAEVDRIERLIRRYLHDTQEDTAEEMDQVREFIRGRRAQMTAAIQNGPSRVPPRPQDPTYTVPLGTMHGSFTARWDDEEPDEPTRVGDTKIEVTYQDAAVEFRSLGAAAYEYQRPARGFGRDRDAPPRVNIRIAGVRRSDGERMTVTVSLDQGDFLAASGEPLAVSGSFQVGDPPSGRRGYSSRLTQSVYGKLRIQRAGIKRGKKVEGELELTLAEVHGGFGRDRERPEGG